MRLHICSLLHGYFLLSNVKLHAITIHLYTYLNRIEEGVASDVEGSIKYIKIDPRKLS